MIGLPSAISGGYVCAAQYMRMSTEHQRYSTENQAEVIKLYAAARGIQIVRTYQDDGKTGLNLQGRQGLRTLLQDIETDQVDFSLVLVYDVSRWGRFQDADESAYYEFVCRRHNVHVHYCAEQFENDGSMSAAVLKTVKRVMAGEYSRELSVKVFQGQGHLIELGFRQGGPAGFGLRRLLVDQERKPKEVLERGARKSLQTDRVILVPGPDDEIAIVREIYNLFTKQRRNEQEIADLLNSRGVRSDRGRPWTRATIQQILRNPKYIGDNVFNRTSFKLKQKRVINPPDMWIRRNGAFTPIVSIEQFVQTAAIVEARHHALSDDELLTRLRDLMLREGTLSGVLIDEAIDMPSAACYRSRFCTLVRAYKLVGYTPSRDYRYIEVNRALRERHRALIISIIEQLQASGASVEQQDDTQLLHINRDFTTSVVIARCNESYTGTCRWLLRLEASLRPDITVAVRLTPGNEDILDYYLFPSIDVLAPKLRLASENGAVLDVYRFDNLTFFFSVARRVQIQEAA
jgi:DNA invertase Pin-like site-specific DNA recombinase